MNPMTDNEIRILLIFLLIFIFYIPIFTIIYSIYSVIKNRYKGYNNEET